MLLLFAAHFLEVCYRGSANSLRIGDRFLPAASDEVRNVDASKRALEASKRDPKFVGWESFQRKIRFCILKKSLDYSLRSPHDFLIIKIPTLTDGAALNMRKALKATFLLVGKEALEARARAAGAMRIMVAEDSRISRRFKRR